MDRIVVVGASLAGLRAVETLRTEGFAGSIALVGAEPHRPYNRPPLSKQILDGEWSVEQLHFRDDRIEDVLDLDLYLGRRASDLDTAARVVILDDGTALPYDAMIIATGSHPRTLPGSEHLQGVHTLRTIEDAIAVRDALDSNARVAVVGGGFVGAEVAAAARRRNLDVTLIECQDLPLEHILGRDMAQVCAELHTDHGTRLLLGVSVLGVAGTDRVERLHLSDGTAVEADLVVVGVGAIPATEWLEKSGLEIDNGVLCDTTCAASVPGVYAAGDVARWSNPMFDGELMRVEHWTHASDQGAAAARALLAGPDTAVPFSSLPYFWSDQYSTRIQFAGRAGRDSEPRVVHGSVEDRRFITLYRRDERVAGVLAFGSPRLFMKYRQLIAQKVRWEDALSELSTSA